MKLRLERRDILFLCISGLVFLIIGTYVLVTGDESLVFLLPCVVYIWCLKYAFRSLSENVYFLCFLMCFFTFLLGGHVINKFTKIYYYDFPMEIEVHADLILLVSLAGVLLGYIITDYCNINRMPLKTRIDYNTYYYVYVRRAAKTLYIATYAFWILTLIDTVMFVFKYGYVAYYISYSSRIPALLRAVGYMSPVTLFIFLATMPTKREAKLPVILYTIYTLLSLGTGRRINFMTGLLFVFAYYMLRNIVNPGEAPWITKKSMWRICLLVPVLLAGMYLFEYVRSDFYVGTSDSQPFLLGFFVRQGTSINVIKYTELYKDNLDTNAIYSLKNTLQWLQNSIFNEFFSLDLSFAFGKQSVDTALNGSYLADFVSYYANKASYLAGTGYGSCYAEELYVDFGYVGVFAGNMLYGFVLCKFLKSSAFSKNIWFTALGFFVIDEILKAPRATFDAFFGQLLYFENIVPFIVISVAANIVVHRRRLPYPRRTL